MDKQKKFVIIFATVILGIALIILVVGMQKKSQLEKTEETTYGSEVLEQETLPDGVIMISTAEELAKIGADAAYPMDGDYALDADIDLSGMEWEPIGGSVGIKGETSGDNVFSGTFNGQGHVIYGLTIRKEGNIVPDTSYGKVGLFGVIASEEQVDFAEVKNLIFADVEIWTDFTNGAATVGTLAGEVNGYVNINNIAIVNGTLTVNPSALCDTVGAGGLIGECRTENTMISNRNITVTNCYNGADVVASGSRSDLVYAGGIIGRIAKSACGQVAQCVNVGAIQYQGFNAYAIASAELQTPEYLANIENCYYLKDVAEISASEAVACSEKTLKSRVLQEGLSEKFWTARKNCYLLPAVCYASTIAGRISMMSLELEYAEGEAADSVKSEITLPETIENDSIQWTSSDESILKIQDGKAVAITDKIGADTVVTLTASLENGFTKDFKLVVIALNPTMAVFDQPYPKVGTPITVSITNHESGAYQYQWTVDGNVINNTGNSYTPTEADLESFISVKVTDTDSGVQWELSAYCSELPVVYVDTADGQAVTSNVVEKDATIRLQGNAEFDDAETYYEGDTTIKGRGNSTWTEAVAWNVKKPYKLKLESKANLFGIGENGENKHWVLLANMIDHTNMRNEIVNLLSEALGMEYTTASTNVILVLNGEYQGIYQLCEHVRIDESRVNVYNWEDTAEDIAKAVCKKETDLNKDDLEDYLKENLDWITAGEFQYGTETYKVIDYYTEEIPEATGGFLLDMDFRSSLDSYKYVSTFTTSNGIPMFFREPEYARTSQALLNYAQNYINAYEAALSAYNFTTTYNNQTVHYTDLFDLDSLVQYWFICEYTNNWDSMKNSTYVYKDIDGKAKMGPAWDYDWGFGNINMYSNTLPFVVDNWHTTLSGLTMQQNGFAEQTYQPYQWNTYLVQDPYFVTKIYEYYQKMRPAIFEDMIKDGGIIDQLEAKYQKASDANDEKWSYSYGNYRGFAFVNGVKTMTQSQTYNAAVESLKSFITKRTEWFDKQFTSVEALYKSLGNTVSDQIQISVQVNGSETVITATVSNASIQSAEFLVNGISQKTTGSKGVVISDNKAQIRIATSALEEEGLNTVEVFGLNATGQYVDGQKNFANFTVK